MKQLRKWLGTLAIALALGSVLAALGCSSQTPGASGTSPPATASAGAPSAASATGPIPAHGKVQAVDAAAGLVEIAHDAIPALQMDAMDMKFEAKPADILKSVTAGEEVNFTLQQQPDNQYAVVSIRPAKKP